MTAEATEDGGWLETAEREGRFVLKAAGRWDLQTIAALEGQLRAAIPAARQSVRLDLAAVDLLDTAGAWVLYRTIKELRAAGLDVEITGAKPTHQVLIEQMETDDNPCDIEPPYVNPVIRCVNRVGAATVDYADEMFELISFFGQIIATVGRTIAQPRRLRLTSLVYHMEEVGLNALPIVGLLGFLIGVVLAYQGADQLQRFGAQVFVVNLLGISVLREIGILLTAIVVAGRSGSAFTAQIGSMKVNEEVDAMRTLGLDPIEVLVLPRLLALVIALPLLAFFADLMGLLGGGLMAWIALDISPAIFIERLHGAVGLWTFLVGIIKAPVFAFLIAMIGCFEGLKVEGSAESVGQRTTRAVVEAIFLVIVFDAIFSVFFAYIGI